MEFKIRPLPSSTEKGTWRKASRIFVSRDALVELTGNMAEGKRCTIEGASAVKNGQAVRREATLHLARGAQPLAKSVVQLSESFRALAGYSHAEPVRLSVDASAVEVPVAEAIVVEDATVLSQAAAEKPLPPIIAPKLCFWEFVLAGELARGDNVFPGMTIPKVYADGEERAFNVISVNGRSDNVARMQLGTSNVKISQRQQQKSNGDAGGDSSQLGALQVTPVAGLESQVDELNDFLSGFGREFCFSRERRSCGMVLQGGHGTGKSLLIERVCGLGWGSIHRIQPRDKLTTIPAIFQKARDYPPSIVVIDGLERLVRSDRENRAQVIECLGDALDQLHRDAVSGNALPQVMVLATCLDYAVDMPMELRNARRFRRHIFFPLPDAAGRRAILTSFDLPLQPEEKEDILTDLSKRTHAYNGTDLENLVDEAGVLATWNRSKAARPTDPSKDKPLYIPRGVFELALKKVQPSSMHDVNLKPPAVHWDDIGGQEALKDRLRLVIEASREPASERRDYFLRPPRGYLLFGPPGCSKTMAAQAMATESDLNFFAVKGPELLNMYVGESERGIRQLFARARANAPSLIFFDEIDALAGNRQQGHPDGSHSGGGGGGGSSSSSLGHSVLATLLTEMDGFEASSGVLVLAATNRPQALDPALLRAGRFSDLIYVAPPDSAARAVILGRELGRRRVEASVDLEALVRLTEGFSGAELANACEAAGQAVWEAERRRLRHEPPAERAQKRRPIAMDDLTAAIARQPKMITPQMLAQYQSWERSIRGDF